MDTIPGREPTQLNGHDCGDCIYYGGCKYMDKVNNTNYCECISQTVCPKNNFVLSPRWEETRHERREANRRHQALVARQKKNKKKKKKRR